MPNRRELGYVSAGSVSTIPATTGYGVATGGTSSSITVSGQNYTLLTFTSTGTLTVTSAGLFDVLLVGGGGGGGTDNGSTSVGGGGGGGGQVQDTLYLSANTTITVGAGGARNVHNTDGYLAAKGGLSQIGKILCFGGGSGIADGNSDGPKGWGATGGGANGRNGSSYNPSLLVSGQGALGGSSTGTFNGGGGGGGGASGAVGGNGSGSTGGAGGAGTDISTFLGQSASTTIKSGGGGGGSNGTGGTGGSGGGAAGGDGSGGAASANTAGGGGGSRANGGGSTNNGGSGIGYVRFKV